MKILYDIRIKEDEDVNPKTIIKEILSKRKIKNIEEFLNPPSPLKMSLKDFSANYEKSFIKVLTLLGEIKEKKQMIIVYTDYDADGITGGAILWETLYLLGFKVMPYVPDRKKEGYGFSVYGIDSIIKKYDPALIISVDHGITKVKEIEYARKKGVKIIITDHHLKGNVLPEAEAIYHIPSLSGSGVSYFFAKEIFANFKSGTSDEKTLKLLQDYFNYDYPALASIGTIADLVPLIGPSRALVKHGLKAFPKIKRHGIKQILKQSGIEGRRITPYEIGFIIAPRINAIGRLQHAIDALRLLCTTSQIKAQELAERIGSVNTKRQDLVEKSLTEAEQIISTQISEVEKKQSKEKTSEVKLKDKIIILVSDHWHEGIIGLIASRLVEKYYRPTIIITKSDGVYKGSARSIASFHITDFLRSLKKHLVDVGGHAAAAGFSIKKENLNGFIATAQKKADRLIKEKDLERIVKANIKIPVEKLTLSLAQALETLEPYGIGNQKPLFLSSGTLTNASLIGKTGTHLKIFVNKTECIAFNKGKCFKNIILNKNIIIIYSLDINRWNGKLNILANISYLETS